MRLSLVHQYLTKTPIYHCGLINSEMCLQTNSRGPKTRPGGSSTRPSRKGGGQKNLQEEELRPFSLSLSQECNKNSLERELPSITTFKRMRSAVLLAILATFLGRGDSICVLDNKRGWNVQCGVRDSYLLRLKDYGGIKANFDFGFGLGDEKGFAESIHNTQGGGGGGGGHYYARNDDGSPYSLEEVQAEERSASRPHQNRLARPATRRQGGEEALPVEHRTRNRGNRLNQPPGPSFALRPPPLIRRQTSGESGEAQRQVRPPRRRRPQTPNNENSHTRQIFVRPGTQPTIVFKHEPAPPPPTPSPADHPTVGPVIGELLKMDASTPADTDHVPSFAAKMFIVREAPAEFNPPGYKVPQLFPKLQKRVEVPRTKFFCEEQNYLPGIYADVQLGCKVFHLCMPAAMGNSLTSFLCPNMTLFDQSIMQCNYWYHVNCENSPNHYDANLPLALSYRKINAAQLPLTAVRNFNNVALLSHNSEEMKSHQTIASADPSITQNLALKRIGEVETVYAQQRMDDEMEMIPRGPRRMFNDDAAEEELSLEDAEEEKRIVKRSLSLVDNEINMRKSKASPLLFKLSRS